MNTDEIKWILYHGRNTDPVSRSCNDRLRRFGFCFVLDEYGSDFSKTAQLAVLDRLLEKDAPNMMLICPANLMYSRYSELIKGCGTDFKMITSSEGTIEYFSPDGSNFYIVSERALSGGSGVLKHACDKIVWDLVMIDAGLSVDGINEELYTGKLKIKTDKLLIYAPFPVGKNGDLQALNRTAAAMLADEVVAQAAMTAKIDTDCIRFNHDAPLTRNYEAEVYRGETARNVTVLRYAFEPSYLNGLRKLTDLKTGMPAYTSGGNLFEEYATEITRLYVKPSYTVRDVNELRRADKKLDCFLDRLDEIIRTTDGRVAVYCVSPLTANYLSKVVYALYSKNTGLIRVERGGVYNTDNIGTDFERMDQISNDRIFITVDSAGLSGDSVKGYTHIFNYELPSDPTALELRAARHGRSGEREFILFSDDNGIFDGRMLSKVLYGSIYDGLMPQVPGRNVLFDLPQAAEYTARCIFELMSIIAYADRFTGSDMILKFRSDFAVPASVRFTEASSVIAYVKAKLSRLARALGIESVVTEGTRDLGRLVSVLRPIFEKFRNTLLYLDDEGRIAAVDRQTLAQCYDREKGEEYIESLADSELDRGLKAAKRSLADFYGENRDARLRECVNTLPDGLKMPVLLNTWRYLSDEYIIQEGFKEFMKKYNEGVM